MWTKQQNTAPIITRETEGCKWCPLASVLSAARLAAHGWCDGHSWQTLRCIPAICKCPLLSSTHSWVSRRSVSSADHSIHLPSVSLKRSPLARLPLVLCSQESFATTLALRVRVRDSTIVLSLMSVNRFPDVAGLLGRVLCQIYDPFTDGFRKKVFDTIKQHRFMSPHKSHRAARWIGWWGQWWWRLDLESPLCGRGRDWNSDEARPHQLQPL